jgi:uncharacterized protein (DUF1810 family)
VDNDPLQRFVAARDSGDTYEQPLAELRAGRKASHWLRLSPMTLFAGIARSSRSSSGC